MSKSDGERWREKEGGEREGEERDETGRERREKSP